MTNIIISSSKKCVSTSKETVVFPQLTNVDFDKNTVFIPTAVLDEVPSRSKVKLYFELEHYAFFQKVKALLSNQGKPKGVFRYRRMTSSDKNESLLVEDLFVITSLFGEPENVFIKRTNNQATTNHVIIALNFGGGTMAHVEYTLADNDSIALDWSGIQQILEFNSDEMSALFSEEMLSSALTINTDTILETAHQVDKNLLIKLAKYRNLVNGGTVS